MAMHRSEELLIALAIVQQYECAGFEVATILGSELETLLQKKPGSPTKASVESVISALAASGYSTVERRSSLPSELDQSVFLIFKSPNADEYPRLFGVGSNLNVIREEVNASLWETELDARRPINDNLTLEKMA